MICLYYEETTDHLVLNLMVALTLWSSVLGWFEYIWVLPHDLFDLFEAWKVAVGSARGKSLERMDFFAAICVVWKERNMRCFEGLTSHFGVLIQRVKYLTASWVFYIYRKKEKKSYVCYMIHATICSKPLNDLRQPNQLQRDLRSTATRQESSMKTKPATKH